MPRSCDVCQTSSALVYCRADAAYLCMACDVKVHGANKLASRHERVWMCEVCEQAPAVVTCKADAAALCAACDTDIHTANPLASRHERFPVMPFFEPPAAAVVGLSNMDAIYTNGCEAGSVKDEGLGNEGNSDEDDEERSAAEAESWLVAPDGVCKNSEMFDVEHPDSVTRSYSSSFKARPKKKDSSSVGFFPDDDLYLDLEHVSAMGSSKVAVGDSIVPVHHPINSLGPKYIHSVTPSLFELDHPLKGAYSLATDSLSHSISSSSHDFGVVPDSALSDVSMPATAATAAQQIPQGQTAIQLEPMAREARVMRYREKRKNRKFEKTIRYASRKAYAEIRPRVKGRFVKRSEIQVAEIFSVVPETAYGVVPTL